MERFELCLVIWVTFSASGGVSHLQWIERTGINAGSMYYCEVCNSGPIHLPQSFPIGENFSNIAFVGLHGVVSFASPFDSFNATAFPLEQDHLVVAPYWTDNYVDLQGRIRWESYKTGRSGVTDGIIRRITNFIQTTSKKNTFNGTFVLVANWSGILPYPNGSPYDQLRNSHQVVLVTDGVRSFAIFIYKCGSLHYRARKSTVGFSAGGNYYANHPFSLTPYSNAVACLNNELVSNNTVHESVWSNIVYELTSTSRDPVNTSSTVTIGFSESSITVAENVSDLTLTVTVLRFSAVSVTVGIEFSGTATENLDFDYTGPTSLTFNPGEIEKHITILVIDDSIIEGAESIIISLTNPDPSDTVSNLTSTKVLVIDNDIPQIAFERTVYIVFENEESIEVCINVSNGAVIEDLTIPVNFIPISATAEDDYSTEEDFIQIATGQRRGCIDVGIINSIMVERDEELRISISEEATEVIVEDGETLLVIKDNRVVRIGFKREGYAVHERGLLEVAVSKSVPCDFNIHCRVNSPGLIDKDVIFRPTENRVLIGINLTDDGVALEPDEIHVLTLSLVVSDPQVLLQPNISYITIVDNDSGNKNREYVKNAYYTFAGSVAVGAGIVTVGFDGTNRLVSESSESVEVYVCLWDQVVLPVTVHLKAVSMSAIEGKDFYLIGSTTLTFLERWNLSYTVVIIDDDKPEDTETFYLTLTNAHPNDSVVASPDTFNIIIKANDGGKGDTPKGDTSTNYILLLSLLIIPIILAAVVLACGLKRLKRSRKTTMNFTNPLNDKCDTDTKSLPVESYNKTQEEYVANKFPKTNKLEYHSNELNPAYTSRPMPTPYPSDDSTKASTQSNVKGKKEVETGLSGQDSHPPEMKPNMAYKMMEIAELNVEDPNHIRSVRARQIAFATVEPYAIINICKNTL